MGFKGGGDPNLCPECRLFHEICLCPELADKYGTGTRITLLIHAKEAGRITNTGRFAVRLLKNSHLELFGLPERPDYSKIILPDYENIILHPMGTGILSQEISGKPLNLIIPDGTWSQSRKMIQSERLLSVLPKYRLPPVALPAGLRKSPAPEYHSTLQSIAGALGVLGERSAEEKLFCISRLILKRLIDRRIN